MAIFIVDDNVLHTLLETTFQGAEREAMLSFLAGGDGDWQVFRSPAEIESAFEAADGVEFVGYTVILDVDGRRVRRFIPDAVAREMANLRSESTAGSPT